METLPPPILIVGTGAMSCLFAARLAASGSQVTLLGTWPEALAALRQDGVCLVRDEVCAQTYPVAATSDPADCAGARFALVLVKSWQTPRAARQLASCLAPDGVALTLQNGAGNFETLVQALGPERSALGVTTVGANLLGPGKVRAAGEGLTQLQEHPRLLPLASALVSAGFSVETAPDPQALLWSKLVINAAINPLTAILRIPNGGLLERPQARELMADLACEAAAVAAAGGIWIPYSDPASAAEEVARRTAANRSSMLQDLERGAPTEIDAICGAIVRAGEQAGVPTPANRIVWKLVKAIVEPGATSTK
jgi:2-dehydropantoate 2-reductase